jgi:transposase
MEVLFDRVAGLDVHRDALTACTRVPRPSGRGRLSQVAEFPTTTAGLGQLHACLVEAGVSHVAMEATGIYWRPVFWALETDFELLLVNAAHVKNVPGRKTDVRHLAGAAAGVRSAALQLRAPSGDPPTAQSHALPQDAHQRAQPRRAAVGEDVAGGRRQADQCRLGRLVGVVAAHHGGAHQRGHGPQRASRARPRAAALEDPGATRGAGNHFDVHHAVIVRSGLDHLDQLDAAILAVSIRINEAMAPYRWATELLCTIPGVSVRTAECLVAEIGADMSVFPTAGHLASWAGMCPGNNKSAGRSGPGTTRPGPIWLRQHLLEAAHAAARTRDNHLAARHARIRARRGSKRAAVATGHSILIAAWHILTRREPFQNLGGDYYRANPASEARRLVKRLQALGLQVTVTPAA